MDVYNFFPYIPIWHWHSYDVRSVAYLIMMLCISDRLKQCVLVNFMQLRVNVFNCFYASSVVERETLETVAWVITETSNADSMDR